MKTFLNPKWLLLINSLPIFIVLLLLTGEFSIIKSLFDSSELRLWYIFGISLGLMGLVHAGFSIWAIRLKKDLSSLYAAITLVIYITFLYLYFYNIDSIFPSNVPDWMFSGNIILYVATFLMPTLIHALFILIIRHTPENENIKAFKNFLFALAVPLFWYLSYQIILPLRYAANSNFAIHLLVVLGISSTLLFLFFLIRGVVILSSRNSEKLDRNQLIWKAPIAILFPILGLLINNGGLDVFWSFGNSEQGIFGNFSSNWFMVIAIINGLFLCLPNLPSFAYRLILFIGKSIGFSFTFYFFLVFLPYLPLSVFAIILFGLGFLMLTPLVLFAIHVNSLSSDFKFLKGYLPNRILGMIIALGALLIPTIMTINFSLDKRVLHSALDYVFMPDYSKSYSINKSSLSKTLNKIKRQKSRTSDFFSSSQTPYISAIFNWVVLDNLTLSNEKINLLDNIFFGIPSDQSIREWRSSSDINITNISTKADYNATKGYWTSWIDLELTNPEENRNFAEYSTEISMPNGCWISDYYLFVEGQKEMGILSEKKSAMWIFSQIRNRNRDPGLLFYKTGNRLSFRVFPFSKGETRKTGIEFIHKEPVTIKLGEKKITLGNQDTILYSGNSIEQVGNTTYVSAHQKKVLPKIKRTPYYHFILDASINSTEKKDFLSSRINNFLLQDTTSFAKNAKISFSNTYSYTGKLNADWQQEFENHLLEGGFYLERTIKEILYNSYITSSDTYPIIIVVSDNFNNSIIQKDFADFKPAFPESNYFFTLDKQLFLVPHSLIKSPKKALGDSIEYSFSSQVLAWPNQDAPLRYLPDNNQADIVLLSQNTELDNTLIHKKDWNSGLAMAGNRITHTFYPEKAEKEWIKMIRASFKSKIMIPETSYIVVENEAQKQMLKKKQKQVLSGKKSLDPGEDILQMSEPRFGLILLLLIGFIAFHFRRRKMLS